MNCLEGNKCGKGHCLVVDRMIQVVGRQVMTNSDKSFVVNCVAAQETYS